MTIQVGSVDRFHLVADVIDRLPALGPRMADAKPAIRDQFVEHKQYINKHGREMPRIGN